MIPERTKVGIEEKLMEAQDQSLTKPVDETLEEDCQTFDLIDLFDT